MPAKRQLLADAGGSEGGEEDLETKRRRVLEETREVDAASDDEDEESSEEESDDEDEEAELLRELEKIKRERAEKKEQEVSAFCSLGPRMMPCLEGSKLTTHDRRIESKLP